MKLGRILAIPFTLAADVVTLGKMGEGFFTQDLFDAERREQEVRAAVEIIRAVGSVCNRLADRHIAEK